MVSAGIFVVGTAVLSSCSCWVKLENEVAKPVSVPGNCDIGVHLHVCMARRMKVITVRLEYETFECIHMIKAITVNIQSEYNKKSYISHVVILVSVHSNKNH